MQFGVFRIVQVLQGICAAVVFGLMCDGQFIAQIYLFDTLWPSELTVQSN